ncbi:hypothetical protein RM844_30130 [Streptomyces sp. DSM 44915]|uniref:Uncharacterized protein n=1 Tax=Streptomyces chisholmiae TaxID=3075540 RepID=A0ABU2JZY5_9ACTN|nr:hypothetical protein [Streptomyces sp. DSM 44915]MDT0270539.1 hypothetical protein [Streptomyces sp. DSM 44915]
METTPDPLDILRAAHPETDATAPLEWLSKLGAVVEAIPYHWLYWPPILEVRGAAFVDLDGYGEAELARLVDERISREAPGRSQTEWESFVNNFNYFEIPYLFSHWREPLAASQEAELALVSLLSEPWQAKLQARFPNRRFTVGVAPPDPSLGVCVEVRQVEPRLTPPAGW